MIAQMYNHGNMPVPLFKHSGLKHELAYSISNHMGTQKFFKLFPLINYTLETGGLLVLDEIDNDIPPCSDAGNYRLVPR